MQYRRLRGRDREEYLEARDEAIDDFLVAGRRLFDILDGELAEPKDPNDEDVYEPRRRERLRDDDDLRW